MKVVILCGGLGTRLREETEFRPKPMVPIGERPILWHIMKFYAHYGHKEFILCLGYKAEMIKQYFFHYQWHCSDVTLRLGPAPEITYHNEHAENDWQVTLLDTGLATQTGGRVRRALAHIKDDEFLLTYGDGLCNVDLPKLIKHHRKHNALATLTAVRPSGRFGELSLKGSTVKSFREKPDSEIGYINGGFFVVNKKIGKYLKDDASIFEFDVLPQVADAGKLNAYRHDDFWQCMDNPREMEILNKLWRENKAPWKLWKE
jgi:glucose-1-phosphate cytidylyltransferase